jgi:hypothetical protein
MLLLALYKYVNENTTKAGVSAKNIADSKLTCNPIAYIMPYVNPARNDAAKLFLIMLLNPNGNIIHNRNGMIMTSLIILNIKPTSKVLAK